MGGTVITGSLQQSCNSGILIELAFLMALGDLNLFLEKQNKNKNLEAIFIAAFSPEKKYSGLLPSPELLQAFNSKPSHRICWGCAWNCD